MRAHEREDLRYADGATNPIEIDEEVMFSLLPSNDGALLDVGCGTGIITKELEGRGLSAVGVDFSRVAVERCRETGIEAVQSDVDADGLKFADNSFDVVWAGDVVEHLFDPLFFFCEAARVVRPGGHVIIGTPNNMLLSNRVRIAVSGRSPQSSTYRHKKQCKHHTVMSWELLEYMYQSADLVLDTYRAVVRLPKSRREFVTERQWIGRQFGRVFIVRLQSLSSDTFRS